MQVFNSLPSALPTFAEWVNYSAGVNVNKTWEVRMGDAVLLALPLKCSGGAVPEPAGAHQQPPGDRPLPLPNAGL